MATTTSGINELYTQVVQDLVPYYMDAVLLPNQSIIMNSVSISGQSGDTVRFPIMTAYSDAGTVQPGTSIATNGGESDFAPTAVTIQVSKKGIATDVQEEALEDGGLALVQQAVLARLSGGLAQATDKSGLLIAATGATIADTGAGSTANTHTVNLVMSPEAMAFATKREPTVKMWFNPDTEVHQMRGTVRNGFNVLRGGFIAPVTANSTIGSGDANIVAVAQAVANLRGQNAPTMLNGQYVSIIDPAMEYAINEQIALAGGAAIGSLSDVGNNALLQGLIGQAAGVMFFRSNNLPDASVLA